MFKLSRYWNRFAYFVIRIGRLISLHGCEWKENDDGFWETECRGAWELTEGTPEANGMKFCPFCGARIMVAKEREGMLTLASWYENLSKLASEQGILWLLTGNPEDYRESYDDGNTPEQELFEQKEAAVASEQEGCC